MMSFKAYGLLFQSMLKPRIFPAPRELMLTHGPPSEQRCFQTWISRWCDPHQVNKESDESIKEKVFSALTSAVKAIQQERAIILNALVRMRMRWSCVTTDVCFVVRVFAGDD